MFSREIKVKKKPVDFWSQILISHTYNIDLDYQSFVPGKQKMPFRRILNYNYLFQVIFSGNFSLSAPGAAMKDCA